MPSCHSSASSDPRLPRPLNSENNRQIRRTPARGSPSTAHQATVARRGSTPGYRRPRGSRLRTPVPNVCPNGRGAYLNGTVCAGLCAQGGAG